MSICDEIRVWVNEGRLFLFIPDDPGACISRPLYLVEEIRTLVEGPWETVKDADRGGALRADLEHFTSGGMVSIAKTPYRAKTALLARLDPPGDEVWEIRSRSPRPGLRVFGRFAKTDIFVALEVKSRDALGGPKDRSWRDEIVRSKAHWIRLFPSYPAHSGSTVHDYISNNLILV